MNPITIKPIASPFPPAMKILLLLVYCLLLVGGNINYYRNPRLWLYHFSLTKSHYTGTIQQALADASLDIGQSYRKPRDPIGNIRPIHLTIFAGKISICAIHPKKRNKGTRGQTGEKKGYWREICALETCRLPLEEHFSGASCGLRPQAL